MSQLTNSTTVTWAEFGGFLTASVNLGGTVQAWGPALDAIRGLTYPPPANSMLVGNGNTYVQTLTLPAALLPAFTGDVTSSPGTASLTVNTGTIGNTKLAAVPAYSIKGNGTSTLAIPQDLTLLPQSCFPGLSGDVTAPTSSTSTTVAAIGGKAVSLGGTLTTSGIVSTSGPLTTASAFATSGAFGLTLTATGTTNVTLPTSGTLIANPMNSSGDIIIGGASGSPSRLAIGANATVLTVSSGVPSWQASTSTGVGLPGAIGLIITNDATTPNSKIDLSFDYCIMVNASGVTWLGQNQSLVINLGTTGANALDTGTASASTWYHVYAISDGVTVAGLASISATSPTLPGGYIYSVRLGAMQTNGSSNLYKTRQLGRRSTYTVQAAGTWPFLYNVTANSTYSAQLVAANGQAAPPTAVSVSAVATAQIFAGSWARAAPNANYYASTGPAQPMAPVSSSVVGSYYAGGYGEVILESTSIYLGGNGASGTVGIVGWVDKVNAV